MSWRKLVKTALPTTGIPTTFGAVGTVMYDSATNILYQQTAATEWSIYPMGTKSIVPDTGSGTVQLSGSAAKEFEISRTGSGTVTASGISSTRYYPIWAEVGAGDLTAAGQSSAMYYPIWAAVSDGNFEISGSADSIKEDA